MSAPTIMPAFGEGIRDLRWIPELAPGQPLSVATLDAVCVAGVAAVTWGTQPNINDTRHINFIGGGELSVPGVIDGVGILRALGVREPYGCNIRGIAGGFIPINATTAAP
jgi:hypothetical protein